MKTTVVCALVAASLGLGSLAYAQPNDTPGARSEQRSARQADRNDRRYDYPDVRRNDRHTYYDARGPQFRRGGYIPYEYRSRQYVVTQYAPYRLSPPPRGHQWVQVGSDYVLIAIATGVIANIILNN